MSFDKRVHSNANTTTVRPQNLRDAWQSLSSSSQIRPAPRLPDIYFLSKILPDLDFYINKLIPCKHSLCLISFAVFVAHPCYGVYQQFTLFHC